MSRPKYYSYVSISVKVEALSTSDKFINASITWDISCGL